MANPFDQFDQQPEQSTVLANPFDQFDNNSYITEPSLIDSVTKGVKNYITGQANVGAGMVRGAGSIGATLLTPVDAAARALGIENDFIGRTDRRKQMDEALRTLGADTESSEFALGKFGGEMAGTAGAGGVLSKLLKPVIGVAAPKLLSAIESGGFSLGAPAAKTVIGKAGDLGLRAVGGGTAGGVYAGAVDPENAGTGVMIGAGLPIGVRAATPAFGALKDIVMPLLGKKGVTHAAARVVRDAAGDRLDDVTQYLKHAEMGETAAQAAAPAGSTELSALQRIVQRKADPSGFRDIRIAEEGRIGQMWDDLNKKLWPLGKKELETANVAGTVGKKLQSEADTLSDVALSKIEDVRRFGAAGQRADALAQSWYPVSGMPRTPGRYSYADELSKRAEGVVSKSADESRLFGEAARFKQMQADSLAAHGLRPLKSDSIVSSINAKLNVPGQRESKVVKATLNDLKERINAASTDGVLDAHDLYTIRKEIGDSVQKFAKENQNWDKRLTSGLEKSIQGTIDDAIERAGGSRWKEYLRKYSEGADKINARVMRSEDARKMASEGMTRARDIAGMDEMPISLPNLLSRPMMIINSVLRKTQGIGSEKTTAEIARLMQNPRELAAVMKVAAPSERAELMKIIAGRGIYIAGSQAANGETQ